MPHVWDTQAYAAHARFVADLGEPVLAVLNPQPGEHILDLGCGDGVLTSKLQEMGCHVVGVDSSPEMIAAAATLGLNVRVLDAQALDYDQTFDAVFSNAALHWMLEPDLVIAGVRRALRPGGRFVGEFGGYGNIATVQAALHQALMQLGIESAGLNPWYFPTPTDYQARLVSQGFLVQEIELIPRPTLLPTTMTDWLATFAQPYLAVIPEASQPEFLETVVNLLRPQLQKPSGQWFVDYVRLRFIAREKMPGLPSEVGKNP